MNSKTIGTLLAAGCLLAYGCGDPGASSSELATRSASGADAAAASCESDLDCPQGEECEFEHGEAFCKPHGGDDNGDDGGARDCESDLDCPQGEECEFEHGGSFCKPHGGDDDDCDDEAQDDDDHHHGDDDDRSGSNSGHG
ncbi:MAG: hypothetical protein JRG93_14090 [Deltaproteobacteria bacterium]|nr:hypothetical protein [Deltaproteobacteria bacterium]